MELPACKYGAACYRRNPAHLRQFSHAGRETKEGGQSSGKKDAKARQPTRRSKRSGEGRERKGEVDIGLFFEKTPGTKKGDKRSPELDEVDVPAAKKPKRAETEVSDARDEEHGDEPEFGKTGGSDGGGGSAAREVGESSGQSPRESEELARESDDMRENVKRKFLVEMPEDFYQFWDFCESINPARPEVALQPVVGLELVGPYHVLAGSLSGVPWQKCVLHSRHFYDPPEFLTVLRGEESTGFHIGYFRDDPKSLGCILVSNCSKVGCEIKPEGENIFGAVRSHTSHKLGDELLSREQRKQLEEFQSKLVARVEELGLPLADSKSLPAVKRRSREVVARTFHKFGIVVPYDKEMELGYRPLPMTDRDLRRLLDRIASYTDPTRRDQEFEPLQEIITFVQFANDECDYGMGFELGMDIFCHGNHFDNVLQHLLPLAYELLQREEFARITREHLKYRSPTPLDFSEVK